MELSCGRGGRGLVAGAVRRCVPAEGEVSEVEFDSIRVLLRALGFELKGVRHGSAVVLPMAGGEVPADGGGCDRGGGSGDRRCEGSD